MKSNKCDNCKGTGEVSEYERPGFYNTEKCVICKGTGRKDPNLPLADCDIVHYTPHIVTRAPVCGSTLWKVQTTYNKGETNCEACKIEIKNAPEKKELKKLYSELDRLTTEFGLNHTGTEVHSQLELALKACRDRWAVLNPKKWPDKLDT